MKETILAHSRIYSRIKTHKLRHKISWYRPENIIIYTRSLRGYGIDAWRLCLKLWERWKDEVGLGWGHYRFAGARAVVFSQEPELLFVACVWPDYHFGVLYLVIFLPFLLYLCHVFVVNKTPSTINFLFLKWLSNYRRVFIFFC